MPPTFGFYSPYTPIAAVALTFVICGLAAFVVVGTAHLFHGHPQPDTCVLCRRAGGR